MQSIVFIIIESLGFGATGIFTSLSAAELLKIVDSLSQVDQLFTNRTYLATSAGAVAATAVRIYYLPCNIIIIMTNSVMIETHPCVWHVCSVHINTFTNGTCA